MLLCLLPVLALAQNPKRYALNIVVQDSTTGERLSSATVCLNKHRDFHITDKNGSVRFDTLRSGVYFVEASFAGYHTREQQVKIPQQEQLVLLLCPESYHLHEVVFSSKTNSSIGDYSLQTKTTLIASQIERMRGQNISDLLANVNGMTTMSTGPDIAKPVLRGLHSNRLVLLNNGIRQEGQQWGAEHAPEIDPFTVNQVDVIKGAASVEYGPEAIGGAVRFTPKDYRKTNGVDGEVSLQSYTNNKQGAASVLLEGTHFNNQSLSWRAQGSIRKAGDSRAPDYVISNTGFEEINGSISGQYTHKQFAVEVFASLFDTKIGIMRAAHVGSSTDLYKAIQSDEPLIIKPFTYDIGRPYQTVWHEVQSARLFYHFKRAGKLSVQAGRQLNARQEYDLGVSWNPDPNAGPAYDLTLTTYTYDAAFEHKTYRHFTGKIGASVMDQSNYTDGIQKPLIPNFIAYTYGAYAFEKWNKGRWSADAGIRFDKRTQTIYVRNSNNEILTQERNYQSATAIAGAGYQMNEQWKLSSTFSSAWRPPSVNELYSNGLHNGTATYEIGDSNLIPERSYNIDINIKHQNEKWVMELSLFRNRIDQFIYQLPVQPPTITLRGTFPTFQFTQTDVVMQGAEVQGNYQVLQHWLAGGALSYLHAQDISNNQPLIYMPANRVKIYLQYSREKIWKLRQLFVEGVWSYVAMQNRYPEGLDYKTPPPSYQLVDVNAGFNWKISQENIRISAGVKNIFNVSYRDYLDRFRYFSDRPGRNFIVRITIPFQLFSSSNSNNHHEK